MDSSRTSHSHIAWQHATKVPQIALLFWVVKLLTTAMGEATADYSVVAINPYVAVGLGAVALAVALVFQFRASRYHPVTYWFTVAMVAVFGTMAADALHVQFGVPYLTTTILFAVILAAVFTTWHKIEGTLSIHSIHTKRREVFYWLAVMATFALGTAAGDMTATTLNLGYGTSILLFATLIAIPAIYFGIRRRHAILVFWCAYVLTRPLGASISDWLSKPHSVGGLGYGDGTIALILTVIIALFVGYLAISRADAQDRESTRK